MKIEILSVPGCPHHATAMAHVRRAMSSLGLEEGIEERWIVSPEQAREQRFPGSPTVRVDGRDVEPVQGQPALACRLYATGDNAPSVELVREAMAAAARGRL